LALGGSLQSRQDAYKSFTEDHGGAESSHHFIQTALSRNQLTGNSSFIDEIESRIGIRIEHRGQRRPTLNM